MWRPRIVILFLILVLILSAGGSRAATLDHCIEAEAAYQAGNHDLEIEHYTRCIDGSGLSAKNRAIAHNNRGVAHYAKGHRDKAIADYDMALSIDPDYAMAFANRGNAYLARGNFDLAMRDFDAAIAVDPEFGLAYSNRCWLFGLTGHAEEALADCDESLRLSPDNATALDNRAFAYWMLEDQAKAREDLEHAHRLDPAHATWQERIRDFEALFSIGEPNNEPSFQSADSRAPMAEDALPDGHAGAEDAPIPPVVNETMPPATGMNGTSSSEILVAGVDVEASVLRVDGEGDVAFEKKLVWLTQRALKKLKYDPGPLDGNLGPRTVSAIKSYQRDYNLTVDGESSRGLLRHMREKRFET